MNIQKDRTFKKIVSLLVCIMMCTTAVSSILLSSDNFAWADNPTPAFSVLDNTGKPIEFTYVQEDEYGIVFETSDVTGNVTLIDRNSKVSGIYTIASTIPNFRDELKGQQDNTYTIDLSRFTATIDELDYNVLYYYDKFELKADSSYSALDIRDSNGFITYLIFKTGNTGVTIDKTKLVEAIQSAPTMGYHQSGDRYNGTGSSEKGFWQDYQDALTEANRVNESEAATQENVDAALAALNAAIAKLIPTTQANTTKLYEALEAAKGIPETSDQYTGTSWDNFQKARTDAREWMKKLFDDSGNALEADNKPENQGAIEQAARVLTAAQEDLLNVDGLSERIVLWQKAATWILNQNDQVAKGTYTEASKTAWTSAYEALTAAVAAGYDTKSKYDAYTSGVVQASSAYYALEDSNPADITVHVRVADNFGAMFPEYAIKDEKTATFDEDVTLRSGNKNIAALLSAMQYDDTPIKKTPSKGTQYDEGWKNPEVMVYINGTLAVNRTGTNPRDWQGYIGENRDGKLTTSKLQFDVQLHDDDDIVILRALGPGFNYYGDIAAGGATYNFYYKSLALLNIKESAIEVEAGKPFSLTVTKTTAAAESERQTYAMSNASLFLSEKQDTEADATSAPALQAVGSKTDTNGIAKATIYKEGWYRLATVDVTPQTPTIGDNNGNESGGNFPNLAAGDYVLVHVIPSTDTASVRKQLQAELDEVYRAYAEEFYGEDAEEVKSLYKNTSKAIADSELLGDAYDAKEAAVAKLQALQKTHVKQNERFLKTIAWYLDRLPSEQEVTASKQAFSKAYQQRFEGLQAAYEAATKYQQSLLDGLQEAQYRALKDIYGTDGTDLAPQTLAKVTVTVEGDPSLQSNLLLSHKYYRYEAVEYIDDGTDDGLIRRTLNETYGTFRPNQPEKGPWWDLKGEFGESNFTMLEGSDEYFCGIYAAKTPTSHKLADLGYEIYKIEVEGAEDAEVTILKELPQGSTSIYDKDTGKQTDSPFRIAKVTITHTPAKDIHIKVYVRSSDATKSLSEYQTLAKEALNKKYQSYTKADYTASGWAALAKAYQDGLDAIEGITDEDNAKTLTEKARDAALAAMAAVKTRAQEQQGATPGGETAGTLGSVTVTVSNATLSGTDTDGNAVPSDMQGTFIRETIPLNQDTTMMTAILDALERKGYTWEGTGGKTATGKDITYIAAITSPKGYRMAEFTGGPESGWMGTLNDWFTNLGFQNFTAANGKLVDGDVIEVQYTCKLGRDIGSDWNNPDTSLASMNISGGKLSPSFSKSQKSYTLAKTGNVVNISAAAVNKNYQVRMYLNSKNAANYYRSGESIPIKVGDTLYVGVGGKGWPSMNSNAGYQISYDETWYEIKVVDSASSSEVIKMIDSIGKITYGNYKSKTDAIKNAGNAYDALTETAKKDVKNYDVLQKAEQSITFYQQIDDAKSKLAALPKITDPTREQANAYRSQINAATAAYNKLNEEQKKYITKADAENYNALAAALGMGTISGSEVIPESPVETTGKTGSAITTSPTEVTMNGTTAAVTIKTDNQKEILKQAKENKSAEVVLTVAEVDSKGAETYELNLDKSFIRSLLKDTTAKLVVKTPMGQKTYDREALQKLADETAASVIKAEINKDNLDKQTEEPADDAKLAQAKTLTAKISLTARSAKTAKKNVKVTLKTGKTSAAAIQELKDMGYTVKYRFYRSTKKSAGYKSMVTKKATTYTNTSGKKGMKYFYKVQVRVYDEKGKLLAKTALKQCKYASRTWTK